MKYIYIFERKNIIGNVNLCIVTVTQSITVNKKSPQQVLLLNWLLLRTNLQYIVIFSLGRVVTCNRSLI